MESTSKKNGHNQIHRGLGGTSDDDRMPSLNCCGLKEKEPKKIGISG